MTDHVFEGVEYTYGSRFRNFNGINQIEALIKDLQANNYSRRAIAFTWDVMKDTGNPKSPVSTWSMPWSREIKSI